MKIFTGHPRVRGEPLLVREGFSWGAAVFGPFWLALHRAWIAAILVACAELAVALTLHGVVAQAVLLWMAWLTGLSGQDLRRAALRSRSGDMLVVAASSEDAALGRLLAARPGLAAAILRPAPASPATPA